MRIYNKYSYGHYIVRFEVFLPIHATGFRLRSLKFSYFRDLRALGFFFFFFPPTLSQITNFWHAEPSCILLSKICQIPAFSVTQQILEPPVQKWIRRLMWIQNLDPPGGLGASRRCLSSEVALCRQGCRHRRSCRPPGFEHGLLASVRHLPVAPSRPARESTKKTSKNLGKKLKRT